MKRVLARLAGLRLQHILVVGYVLTTAITLAVGTPVTYGVIDRYLKDTKDERVSRDMDLANAFYLLKLHDISAMAERLARLPVMRRELAAAEGGDLAALTAIDEAIDNEVSVLSEDTQRFVVTLDAKGLAVVGRVCCRSGRVRLAVPNADWSGLGIASDALSGGQALSATEVIPVEILQWIGLAGQASIPLEETPFAAPEPFDAREGTAGLALVSVVPLYTLEEELLGAVLVGHLFNNDFTLVDRIAEVAGVDTATIFFGDLRVSTNVPNPRGGRAVGTRVSESVYEQVLVNGETFTGPAFVVEQWYISRYEPLRNHLEKVVGILYVGAKQSSFQRLLDSFRRQVLLIAGLSLVIAILIGIPAAWLFTRPLADLVSATRRVAGGDWGVRVPPRHPREMTLLAESFNTMVETLQETQEQLVQKEKLASVGQLAAGVAHEINNPLGSILLYADIMRKETQDSQQSEDLAMIMNEATRCKTIVNDLLNFSRQNQVLAQQTSLNELLAELCEEAVKQDLFHDVELKTELDPQLPVIQADPLQLRQVFVNLMDNAAEAMPKGGRLTLRTSRGPGNGFVTVEVHDTGVGIPEQNMKKLFTPFFTTKPIGKGTGLGLAIIYGIVKMHRGQITVRSQPGEGTTFTVTLRERLPSLGQGEGVTIG